MPGLGGGARPVRRVAPGTATVLALLLATAPSMVFGELVPKNLAIANPLGVARAVVWLQSGFAHAFRLIARSTSTSTPCADPAP
jgi:CBS domain containing-hemolysin-like protein